MGGTEGPTVEGRHRADRDRSEARLRALSDIGRAGVGAPPGTAVRMVLLAAMRALDGDSASLGIWDDDAQLLRVSHNVGDLAEWEEPEPLDEVYVADQSTWLAGMADGLLGAVLCLDDPDLALDDREYLVSLGKHSSVSIPVLYAGQWWGELFCARKGNRAPFTEDELEWGTAVAAQVGAALETLEHLDRIGRLAQTDPLTGLANRRALDEWLDVALVGLRERGQPVGLMVCDLNGLKQINDDQGHDAGDRALVQFADFLKGAQRSLADSIVARLGGDEFCLAVAGADVDRLLSASTQVCRHGWESLPYGVACGMVSTVDAVGPVDNAGRLFRLADAAQYRAKRTRSVVPVVAGRALPPELAVPLAEQQDGSAPDRRLLRGRDGGGSSHLLEGALRALDQAEREPVPARLGLVADLLTHHIDALGWWISFAAAGSAEMRTAEYAIYRAIPGLSPGELETELGAAFPLVTYPQSAHAMRGGGFTVHAHDLTADPAELAILDGLRATSVVGAGGTDPEGDRWLVEIFTDELSAFPQELPGAMRLLVLAALHPPAPG
jgi:diguanylate cyclase (GGDEF)-like protein